MVGLLALLALLAIRVLQDLRGLRGLLVHPVPSVALQAAPMVVASFQADLGLLNRGSYPMGRHGHRHLLRAVHQAGHFHGSGPVSGAPLQMALAAKYSWKERCDD